MPHPSYTRWASGRLFVVRWNNACVEGVVALGEELRAYHAELREPLFFVFLVGRDSPVPDRATREMFQTQQAAHAELTMAMRTVVLPGNLRQRVVRQLLSGMRLAAAFRGRAFDVDPSPEALAELVHRELGLDPTELLRALLAAEVLRPDELAAPLEPAPGYHRGR